MANDMIDTLKGMLGDNAEEKIQTVLQSLQSGNSENEENTVVSSSSSGITPDYVSQMKNIINQIGSANDSRSNLLLSLKPYMRAERKKSIDSAVKILNLSKLAGLFK